MKLTTPQRKALERLLEIGIENLPGRDWTPDPNGWDARLIEKGITRIIYTGINSQVLRSLHVLGLIDCAGYFLRGHVTGDLVVTEKGRAAVCQPIGG